MIKPSGVAVNWQKRDYTCAAARDFSYQISEPPHPDRFAIRPLPCGER
jgi:hypothetical protein